MLTPEELEYSREQGRAARTVVPDAVFNRAVQRLYGAVRRNAQQRADEQPETPGEGR